jgi:hypothetical protein
MIGQDLLEIIQANKNCGGSHTVPLEHTEVNGSNDGINDKKNKNSKSGQ